MAKPPLPGQGIHRSASVRARRVLDARWPRPHDPVDAGRAGHTVGFPPHSQYRADPRPVAHHDADRAGAATLLRLMSPRPSLAIVRDAMAHAASPNTDLVLVESEQGSVLMRATLDDGMRPAAMFSRRCIGPTSSPHPAQPGTLSVHALTDPVSGQPDLKGTRVRVLAVVESWRGVLLRLGGWRPGIQRQWVWWAKERR